jgi:hypothetical protein
VDARTLVGGTLVAGLVIFMVGAVAWRLTYEQPLRDALRVIHTDRRRRTWIHVWMLVALFVTPAGITGFAVAAGGTAAVPALMAAQVYGLGAVCWITSLAFRLTVVPWAAQRTVADGDPPNGFAALDSWAGMLHRVHMAASYAASALLGAAVVASATLPDWLGWLGIAWGVAFLAGFVATRFAGLFNPPFWAHSYTGVVGVVLLAS